MRFVVVVFLLFCSLPAFAGGRGGHNTTFDQNSNGGGWKFLDSDYGAVCDGNPANAATNDAAIQSWLAFGAGQGGALAKLKTPPGRCVVTNGALCADVTRANNNVVQNALIWAYGTTFTNAWIGGFGYPSSQLGVSNSALIQAATTGDASLAFVNASDASLFSVGDRIAITAEATQTFGSPVSHSIFEYNLITSITGTTTKVAALASLVKNSGYKTTYPQLDTGGGGNLNQGGPATIYKMDPEWNTNCRILGLTIDNPAAQVNAIGRELYLLDVTFNGSLAPSASGAVWINYYTGLGNSIEVDKNIPLWSQYNSNVAGIAIQNASVNQLLLTGGSSNFISGTPINITVTNHKTAGIRVAPVNGGGMTLSTTLDGVTFTSADFGPRAVNISAFSTSGSPLTLTIPKASGSYNTSTILWVAGAKYFLGDSDGSNSCTPSNTFTVSDIVDAGANVNIVTNLSSIPVTNICGGNIRPPSTFAGYQTQALTQKFSGPANLLSRPEMLPP